MLWKVVVSGLYGRKHGIVSAHNLQDWRVRKSIEYVRKDDQKGISDLHTEVFF